MDNTGALPGASIVAREIGSGFMYEAVNDADSAFALKGLRPGAYEIRSCPPSTRRCSSAACSRFGNVLPADPDVPRLADAIYRRIDFQWMLAGDLLPLSYGWKPGQGFLESRWDHYCELMILYVLAIGSPAHPIPAESWYAWTRPTVTFEGSLMFAPDITVPALREMHRRFGRRVYGRSGFADAFHPTNDWVNPDVIGIDLGITLLSAENLRTGRVQAWFMRNPEIRRGMQRAQDAALSGTPAFSSRR